MRTYDVWAYLSSITLEDAGVTDIHPEHCTVSLTRDDVGRTHLIETTVSNDWISDDSRSSTATIDVRSSAIPALTNRNLSSANRAGGSNDFDGLDGGRGDVFGINVFSIDSTDTLGRSGSHAASVDSEVASGYVTSPTGVEERWTLPGHFRRGTQTVGRAMAFEDGPADDDLEKLDPSGCVTEDEEYILTKSTRGFDDGIDYVFNDVAALTETTHGSTVDLRQAANS